MPRFTEMKKQGRRITMLTAYDYPTACRLEEAGVDVLLVGDSVGTNVLGYTDETQVTMDDMIHHTRAVARGVRKAYLIGDMPYRSHETTEAALENARRFMDAGAHCVKLEGWADKTEVIASLVQAGIDVCGHIGFNPQDHGPRAKVFGKNVAEAEALIDSAESLARAGVVMLVLEMVPDELSRIISDRLAIPTIGIGSGPSCDGQVLVINDLLGITPRKFKHARRYADYHTQTFEAVKQFCHEVAEGTFPGEDNYTHMADEELEVLRRRLQQ